MKVASAQKSAARFPGVRWGGKEFSKSGEDAARGVGVETWSGSAGGLGAGRGDMWSRGFGCICWGFRVVVSVLCRIARRGVSWAAGEDGGGGVFGLPRAATIAMAALNAGFWGKGFHG